MSGTVYVARAGDTNLFKVGFTSGDPAQRLAALQTGCPFELVLHDTIVSERAGSIERRVHDDLADARVRGEWFEVSPERLDAVLDRYRPDAAELADTEWIAVVDWDTDVSALRHVERDVVYVSIDHIPPTVAMGAVFDGVAILNGGMVFAPAAWVMRERPGDTAEAVAGMVTRLRAITEVEFQRCRRARFRTIRGQA